MQQKEHGEREQQGAIVAVATTTALTEVEEAPGRGGTVGQSSGSSTIVGHDSMGGTTPAPACAWQQHRTMGAVACYSGLKLGHLLFGSRKIAEEGAA